MRAVHARLQDAAASELETHLRCDLRFFLSKWRSLADQTTTQYKIRGLKAAQTSLRCEEGS